MNSKLIAVGLIAGVFIIQPVFAQTSSVKVDGNNIEVKSPDGNVTVNNGAVEVNSPDGNVKVDGDRVEVNSTTEENTIGDEGYGTKDQEYNDAEVNAEIPDEYFNDEQGLDNEEAAPAAEDNAEMPMANPETPTENPSTPAANVETTQ